MPPEVVCNCGEYHDTRCLIAKLLRNCWCTPLWLALLLGWVELDPCSNGRSHIKADVSLYEDDDGLTYIAPASWRVFINPPYGHGQVIRWIRHYVHTRFIFLLRWDPSTAWFQELLPQCDYVWFPPSRVDFEPPPRIRESSNPYPHALYLRDPPEDLLERLKGAGYLFRVDEAFIAMHLRRHEDRQTSVRPRGNADREDCPSTRRARGSRAGVRRLLEQVRERQADTGPEQLSLWDEAERTAWECLAAGAEAASPRGHGAKDDPGGAETQADSS